MQLATRRERAGLIRVMHVVDGLGTGGLENGLANLIERLDRSRFEHVVFAMRHLGPTADRLSGLAHIELKRQETPSRFQVNALAEAIRRFSPDIVHSRNWAGIEAVVAAWRVGSIRTIHSEHGLDAENAAHEPWRRRIFRRFAFHLVDTVMTVSCQLRDLHARRTGFPANRIRVIHNGVDHRRFSPDLGRRRRVRAEWGIDEDEFCIGCVGNLTPVKDYPTLLSAVAEFARSEKKWRVLIAGTGPEAPKLRSFVDCNPEWKGRVSFLGVCDRVPDLLRAMDVYVLSSISEGLSNSLLEAMATGLPVVTTATGGNPEAVVDGDSGLLFPVAGVKPLSDHLRRIRRDDVLRHRLGENAMHRVREEFSIDSMISNYSCMYESVAARSRRPALVGA